MNTYRTHRQWLVSAGVLAVWFAGAGTSLGQYQVNQPGDPGPNAPVAKNQDPANRPGQPLGPGRELYGNNNVERTPLYGPQILPLPSEVRMAQERSGALPSEIRMQAEAAGPLSPHGGFDYIPVMSPLQQAVGMTPPVLFGPAWERPMRVDPRIPAPLPSSSLRAQPFRRTVDDTPSPLDVTPKPLTMGHPIDARVNHALGPITREEQTVTRIIPRTKGPPSTQPTNPSLAPEAWPSTQPVGVGLRPDR